MATASVPVQPEEYECTICHEYFKEPKILPCGHLLCRHCLLSWLQSQDEALCPLCRCPIIEKKAKKSGKSLARVADGFLTDSAMGALVEAHRLLSKQHTCCACVNVAAVCLCVDCGDMFCQGCTTLHKKQSMSKNHAVEKLSSLTPEKLAASSRTACAAHSDKLPEVFCPTHGQSVCLRCATTVHRQCPDVMDLEEKVGQARTVLAELAATLTTGENKLEQSIKQLDEQLKQIDRQTQSAIAELRVTFDRLETAVKTHRQLAEEQVLKTSSDKKKSLLDAKNHLLKRRGKLTSHKIVVVRSQGVITRHEVTDMTPEMRKLMNGLDRSTSLPANFKVSSGMTLVIDPEEVSQIERALSDLGKAKVTSTADGAMASAIAKPMYRSVTSRHVQVWQDVDVLCYSSTSRSTPVAQFIAPQPLSPQCDNFAFEIINEGEERCIAIGLCPLNYCAGRQPGWDSDSVGYHADDGGIFAGAGHTTRCVDKCSKGDIMVCKLDFSTSRVHFYKNFAQVFAVRVNIPHAGFHPIVGMHSQGEAVKLLQKEPWQ
ncbi:E3 ubiquitin-protein ligase TRIM33-like [Littorina saxatilis]|uniref:RING-type domain-containing protein n=1 Tax=Littorina saxatilis TaxID=31220 RepID=A0AAN9B1W9_9CAEN